MYIHIYICIYIYIIYIYIYIFITFSGIEILLFVKQCQLKFMSGNTWWSKKVGTKLLSLIFSILSSDIPLDFHESMPLKYLMYFLAGLNTI